jgi:hypothetical protein
MFVGSFVQFTLCVLDMVRCLGIVKQISLHFDIGLQDPSYSKGYEIINIVGSL